MKGNGRLVLLALAKFADDEGLCWPSQPTLVEKTGLHRNAVKRELQALVDAGVIEVAEAGTGRRSTRYQLQFEREVFKEVRSRRAQPQNKRSRVFDTEPSTDLSNAGDEVRSGFDTEHPRSNRRGSPTEHPGGSIPTIQGVRYATLGGSIPNPELVSNRSLNGSLNLTTARERAMDHKPMALVQADDSPPSLAAVRSAQTLIKEIAGIQPRKVVDQLTGHLSDAIHRGIGEPVVRQAMTEWLGSKYAPGALPSFISRIDRSTRPAPIQSTTNNRVAQALALAESYPEEPA